MPDLQGIKKAKSKGKKANRGPQDFKKQKVKVGRKVGLQKCVCLSVGMCVSMCVRVCECLHAHSACVHGYVRACARVFVRALAPTCVFVCVRA